MIGLLIGVGIVLLWVVTSAIFLMFARYQYSHWKLLRLMKVHDYSCWVELGRPGSIFQLGLLSSLSSPFRLEDFVQQEGAGSKSELVRERAKLTKEYGEFSLGAIARCSSVLMLIGTAVVVAVVVSKSGSTAVQP